jgi:hypothetical protein
MKKAFFVNFIWIFIILIFHISFYANEAYGKDVEMEMYYKRLSSEKFEERNEAVHFFYEPEIEDLGSPIMKALIDLFRMEEEKNAKVKDFFKKGGTADKLPNDIAYVNSRPYGLYYLYLCRLASKSKDKSLLDLLLRSCWDPEAITNFGDDAVEPVINALKKPGNPGGRITVIQILGEMLKPKETGYVAGGEIRNRIKEVLIQETKDGDRYVRSTAVRVLGDSRDKDVIPIIDDVAKNDPYFYEKKDESTGNIEKFYPVRMTAKEIAEKLKAKDK